jgi:hypothetical protein
MSESNTPAQPGQSDVAAAEPEKKPVADKKPADAPKKLELTEEELEHRVSERLEAEKRKAEEAEAARKAEEKAARDKERGEFKSLYEAEQARVKAIEVERDTLKLQVRRREADAILRDHIAAEARDYLPAVKYMAPLLAVNADTKDDEIRKQVKDIVAAYVQDNPRGTGTLPQKPPFSTEPNPTPGNRNGAENPFLHRLAGM